MLPSHTVSTPPKSITGRSMITISVVVSDAHPDNTSNRDMLTVPPDKPMISLPLMLTNDTSVDDKMPPNKFSMIVLPPTHIVSLPSMFTFGLGSIVNKFGNDIQPFSSV